MHGPFLIVFLVTTAAAALAYAAGRTLLAGGSALAAAATIVAAAVALAGFALLGRAAWADGRRARERGSRSLRHGGA